MQTKVFETPALYGDHHVIEVRRILLETPGVADVYASSAFHVVEVTYDPEKINDLEIALKLDQAGYLGEWSPVAETGAAADTDGKRGFTRHTAIYEQTRQTVSFAQNVSYLGRPLWPCPGMGILRGMNEEK